MKLSRIYAEGGTLSDDQSEDYVQMSVPGQYRHTSSGIYNVQRAAIASNGS
jgi:hypothetical protein